MTKCLFLNVYFDVFGIKPKERTAMEMDNGPMFSQVRCGTSNYQVLRHFNYKYKNNGAFLETYRGDNFLFIIAEDMRV